MGIQAILQIGILLSPDVASTTAAFHSQPEMPPPAPAVMSARDAGYVQATWSARDGVPAASDYLVSDFAGMLLLWSAGGLHRFDGDRFSRVENPDGSAFEVEGVLTGQRGSRDDVWVPTRGGEAIRLRRDGIHRFGARDGLPADVEIRHIAEGDGETLAATGNGLYRLRDGRWSQLPLEGLVGRKVWNVRFDGQQWWAIVGSELTAIQRDFNVMHKVTTLTQDTFSGLVGDAQSGVWLWQTMGKRNLCRLGAGASCYTIPDLTFPDVGNDGFIWWVNGSRVFGYAPRRLTSGTEGQMVVIETQHLLDEVEASVDGTLWCIAGGRLLQLARTPIQFVPSPVGAVVPATGNDVWVASFETGMHRVGFPKAAEPLFRTDEGHVRAGPFSTTAGRGRRLTDTEAGAETRPVLLSRGPGGLRQIVRLDDLGHGQIVAATLEAPFLWLGSTAGWAPHHAPPLEKGTVVRGIARDRSGRLLVGAMRGRHGLYRFNGREWDILRPDGKDRMDVTALYVDEADRIWLGDRDDTVTRVTDDTTRTFGAGDGLNVGMVRAFGTFENTLWVAGMRGIARLQGERFETLQLDGRTPVHGVTGFAFDDRGDLWLGAAQGFVRVAREQWTSAVGKPTARARFTLLGELAGVDHPAVDTAPLPTVTRSADGALWFSTLGGLYRLDPSAIPPPRQAPPLTISALAVDGARYSPASALRLPAGAQRLIFTFHAAGPVVAEQTGFRYRVIGLEDTWSEISKGEVVLDRLPPGNYVFELQASAEDGAWTGVPASQAFLIPPTFWQSDWSRVALALLLCALAAIALLLRARQLDARRRAVAEGRLREREKIARDMHDTLLQGLNGLLMTMQSVVARLSAGSPERSRLETSIDIAERVLVEGRDRVSALRLADSAALDLARALQVHARDLAYERRILCEVSIIGEPAPLAPSVEDELIQIGREALTNAFVHSCATEIVLHLGYTDADVYVEVCDNGIGLRPSDDAIRKHWGIQGMQERAAAIGGLLQVSEQPEGGVCVVVRVPANAAYLSPLPGVKRSLWTRLASRSFF